MEKAQERLKAEFTKSNLELDRLRDSHNEHKLELDIHAKKIKEMNEGLGDAELRIVTDMNSRLNEMASKEEMRAIKNENEKQEKVQIHV